MKKLLVLLALLVVVCKAGDVITPGHPRLLTPAQVTMLHSRVTSNNPYWVSFKAQADKLYGDAFNGTFLDTEATMVLALHNIPGDLTDGGAYDAHTATQWMTELMRQTYGAINAMCGSNFANCSDSNPPLTGNSLTNSAYRYMWIYDWLNDLLTTQQKTDLYHVVRYSTQWTINNPASSNSYKAWCTAVGPPNKPGAYLGPDDNQCLGLQQAEILLGIATYGDGINPRDNQDRFGNVVIGTNYDLDYALNDTTTTTPVLCCGLRTITSPWQNTGLGVGGFQMEGPEYGSNDVLYQGRIYSALANGTNFNIATELPNFLDEITQWVIYWTNPKSDGLNAGAGGFYNIQYSDVQAGSQFRTLGNMRAGAEMFSSIIPASDPWGNYLRFWIHNMFSYWDSGNTTLYPLHDVLFEDFPSAVQTDWRTAGVPLNYFSNTRCTGTPNGTCGFGASASYSQFGPNATAVFQKSGDQSVRHGHMDAGAPQMFRQGRWLLLDVDGYVGTGAPESAELHSMFNVSGSGDNGAWKATLQPKESGPPVLSLYENLPSDKYVYTQTINTNAYRSTLLVIKSYGDYLNTQYIRREMFYLKPDQLVILDSGTFRDATKLGQYWMTAAQNTPVVTNGVLVSQNIDQQVSIKPLYPAGVVFNTAVPSTVLTFTTNCLGGCPEPNTVFTQASNYGAGQTVFQNTVKTTVGANSGVMLSFIEGEGLNAVMTPANLIQSGNLIGVDILNATTEQVVGFSNSASGVNLVLPVSYAFAQTTSSSTHTIANLPPGQKVVISIANKTITITANASGTNTISPNGVLNFQIAATAAPTNLSVTNIQ